MKLSALTKKFDSISYSYQHCINALLSMAIESACDFLQFELDMWIEIETMKEVHEEKLQSISLHLQKTKAALKRRELRLQNFVKMPFGYCSINRPRKDLSTLALGRG